MNYQSTLTDQQQLGEIALEYIQPNFLSFLFYKCILLANVDLIAVN